LSRSAPPFAPHRREGHHQQRRFPGSKLHIAYAAQKPLTIPDIGTNNLAHIRRARFQLTALLLRNLQLEAGELLGITDAIHAGKLQHHAALVKPVLLQLQLAAAAVRRQSRQLAALGEALRKIGVQVGQNFAAPSLRLQHASDRDELAGYSRISN
jgi:hypothetical protein